MRGRGPRLARALVRRNAPRALPRGLSESPDPPTKVRPRSRKSAPNREGKNQKATHSGSSSDLTKARGQRQTVTDRPGCDGSGRSRNDPPARRSA